MWDSLTINTNVDTHHQMKIINGGFSTIKDDQFMGLGSVGKGFNDEQNILPTKSDLGNKKGT